MIKVNDKLPTQTEIKSIWCKSIEILNGIMWESDWEDEVG